MCPLTPFGIFVTYVYNCTSIITAVMIISRYEYFWVGLLVMAALVFLVWLEFCWRMLAWKIGALKKYKKALRTNNPDVIRHARQHYEADSWADIVRVPLERAGIVALIGLIAIPLGIIGLTTDAIKARRACRKV